MIDRDGAWAVLTEFTRSDSLRKHALAVEAAMRAYAAREGADAEAWGIAGMLHDFDYEMHPSAPRHPLKGAEILARRGVPEAVVYAILAHADYSGVARESHLEKALFACDELTGFLTACALVKPTKSIHDVEVAGVKKKMKDKAFARNVNRQDILEGAQELGVPLEEHIEFCVKAMQARADELGLRGTA